MADWKAFLESALRDGVVLRLIGKWLNAGVMEFGAVTHPEAGSPQGGVVSPVLANVYLHYVLDQWFAREVQPRLKGRAYAVRYADDFVIGFTEDEDARRGNSRWPGSRRVQAKQPSRRSPARLGVRRS